MGPQHRSQISGRIRRGHRPNRRLRNFPPARLHRRRSSLSCRRQIRLRLLPQQNRADRLPPSTTSASTKSTKYIVPTQKLPDIRGFFKEIATDERASAVLRKSPSYQRRIFLFARESGTSVRWACPPKPWRRRKPPCFSRGKLDFSSAEKSVHP